MRRRLILPLGLTAALVAAAPAAAAQVTVGADDTVQELPLWAPGEVTIAPGDSVVWTLETPVQVHDVVATTQPGYTPWSFEQHQPAKSGTFTFTAPGRYRYYCQFHSGDGKTGMVGTIVVGNPPPPPPPPLSEQPFPNDGAITTGAFETGGLDRTGPALSSVAAKRSGKRVKVSFKVSEQSVVTVRLARGGKTVKSKRARTSGRGSVTVAGLKAGRYAVKVSATDVAGNASRTRSASFRVR